jgi:hypothetical protein
MLSDGTYRLGSAGTCQKLVKHMLESVWETLFLNYDVRLVGPLPKADYVAVLAAPVPVGPTTVRVVKRRLIWQGLQNDSNLQDNLLRSLRQRRSLTVVPVICIVH